MARWPWAFVVTLALLTVPVPAQQTLVASEPVHANAVAVATTADGRFFGVSAGVEAWVVADGDGDVFVDTKPLAETDMQGSARLAAQVAAQTLGVDWRGQDYFVVFRSESTVIGGPSAGAVMALALTVALHNLLEPEQPWHIDAGTAVTGTINPDGTIGPVGGIPEKAHGVAAGGLDRFLYPAGQELTASHATDAYGRPVLVDMNGRCADLRITCTAVASVRQALQLAAGVTLADPDPPVPGTSDYGALLAPSVEAQVMALEDAIAAAGAAQESADQYGDRVADLIQTADGRLEAAHAALDSERYYTAATRAFQGRIFAGQAASLAGLPAAEDAGDHVRSALDACQAGAAQAQRRADALEADDWNSLFATGAAQIRVQDALDLETQARALYEDATSVEDWVQSLFTSTFCQERAETVEWWAGLADAFGPGAEVEHLDALVEDSLDRARELATYAQAVVGSAGEAARLLADAQAHRDAGQPEAAALLAVEAQTAASLALQTGGGTGIAPATLEAARSTASQAIANTRAAGSEPIVSVAGFELAADLDDDVQALSNLWTARSTALLATQPTPEPVTATVRPVRDSGAVVAVFVLGAVAGAGGVLVLATVAWTVRRW